MYEQGVALAGQLREIVEGAEARVRMLRVKVEEDEVQLREVEAAYDRDAASDNGPVPIFGDGDDDEFVGEPRS